MSGKLLSITDTAKELGIAVVTLRSYIKKGKINPIRIGGLLRFPKEEVERVKNDGITLVYVRGKQKNG